MQQGAQRAQKPWFLAKHGCNGVQAGGRLDRALWWLPSAKRVQTALETRARRRRVRREAWAELRVAASRGASRSERCLANAGSVNGMNDQTLMLPIPDEVLDAIAEKVASIVVPTSAES